MLYRIWFKISSVIEQSSKLDDFVYSKKNACDILTDWATEMKKRFLNSPWLGKQLRWYIFFYSKLPLRIAGPIKPCE